jgi:ribosomal-protein-alanine N-acetyltransferase
MSFAYDQLELHRGDVRVRPGRLGDLCEILAYFTRNRLHLAPYQPSPPPNFYTEAHFRGQLARAEAGYDADQLLHCYVFLGKAARVVGVVNLSNFVRGAFQACHLGYSIDEKLEGTGTLYEAVSLMVEHAFAELGMHRVMANYMPENERSGRLLARLGFTREGLAPRYLRIAGAWRDHVLTSRINEAWRDPESLPPPPAR